MNRLMKPSRFAPRTIVWIASCGVGLLLVATWVLAAQRGADADRGGAAPYTPTRGEWLCLFLNSRQALMNSERAPGEIAVHYLYDSSKPDVIRIQLRFGEGTSEEQIHRYAARANEHAIEAAKVYGWEKWLKIEHEERKVGFLSKADALIR